MKRNARSAVGVLALLLVLLLVMACATATAPPSPAAAPASPAAAPTAAAPASATQSSPFRLTNLKISAPAMPVYAAGKLGFFQQNDLRAEVVDIADVTSVFNALLGRSVEMIAIPPNNLIAANAGGKANLRGVMSVLNVTLLNLMARPELKTIKDLRGKTGVATGPKDVRVVLANALFVKNGIDPNREITWLTAGTPAGMLATLVAGRADFSLLPAPQIFELEGRGFNTLARAADYGIYPSLSILTRQDVIDRDPVSVQRAVRAIAQAIGAMKSDKKKTVDMIMENLGLDDRPLAERTYDWVADGWEASCVARDGLDRVKADVAADIPEAAGMPVTSFVDESFVRQIAAKEQGIVTTNRCGGG